MITIPDNVRPEFEGWYLEHYKPLQFSSHPLALILDQVNSFYYLPFEMQSGVWIKFCESKGHFISIEFWVSDLEWWWAITCERGTTEPDQSFNTRQEAEISAINKALELISKTIE